MSLKELNDEVLEVILKWAIINNREAEIAKIEEQIKNEPPFQFSKRHEVRMRRLFARAARWDAFKAIIKVMKKVGFVIMLIANILFFMLLMTTRVREAIGSAMSKLFEKIAMFF